VSTEQHIDTGVIDAALDAWFAERGVRAGIKGGAERDAMEAAICAVDEKRRELAQADPERQEYAYLTCWMDDEEPSGEACLMVENEFYAEDMRATQVRLAEGDENAAWVERALLGTWERV
jgi:hypothetical protein